MTHRGDFTVGNYSHDEWAELKVDWEAAAQKPTEAQIAQWKAAQSEAQTALEVCHGVPEMAKKMLATHKQAKAGQRPTVANKYEQHLYRDFTAAMETKSVAVALRKSGPVDFNTYLARWRAMGQKKLEHKSLHYAVKATDTGGVGVITGYLSTWGLDQMNDQISPNAYDATLADAQARRTANGGRYLFPMLWNHDAGNPIGGWISAVPDSHGLKVTGEVDLSSEDGRRAFSAATLGYVDGLSIGYNADKVHWKGNTRVIDVITLYEGSVVVFPAASDALITGAGLN